MATPAQPDLYPQLLGSAWAALPEVVRRLHQEGRACGRVTIERGPRRPARWLARLLRLPPAGLEVPTFLVVTSRGDEQVWSRRFGEDALVSRQRCGPGGLLAERFSGFECVFRLRPTERGIDYDLAGTALVLGGLRLPLPRGLGPHVAATTRAEEDAMALDVSITVPLLGLILRYHGHVKPDDREARA